MACGGGPMERLILRAILSIKVRPAARRVGIESMSHRLRQLALLSFAALFGAGLAGCRNGANGESVEPVLTVYSGRTEVLVEPVVEAFRRETGLRVRVNYADTSQLAATVLEEGARSPADVFIAQDAATMALLEDAHRLRRLDDEVLGRVDRHFRSPRGTWVGTSGRARVIAYNTDRVKPEELPHSVEDLTDPKWRGRLGWTPTNASFQSFLSAMIQLAGEDAAREWLEGMRANGARVYPSNAPLVQAVANGEIDAGLTNHYYLHRLQAESPRPLPVRNHFLRTHDAGSLVNVSAAGVLDSAPNPEGASRFVAFLLSETAQRHFAEENFEFPVAAGVQAAHALPSIESLEPPEVDLSGLGDLGSTVRLLRSTGVTP